MRALDPEVFDALWEAVEPLVPVPVDNHPTGGHRRRIPDTFPQALRLGANSIGWPRCIIDEWLANRPPACQ